MEARQILEAAKWLTFVLAGNAHFTIVNSQTGGRFTYRVSGNKRESEVTHWVCVLTGPENTTDYTFIGFIKNGEFHWSRRGNVSSDAKSVVAFGWFYRNLKSGTVPSMIEFWHAGRCCRCGRLLTVPDSVAAGIGPECAERSLMAPMRIVIRRIESRVRDLFWNGNE